MYKHIHATSLDAFVFTHSSMLFTQDHIQVNGIRKLYSICHIIKFFNVNLSRAHYDTNSSDRDKMHYKSV